MIQVCNQSLPSVVMVCTTNGCGTGFVADKCGLIITNAHVVEDWKNVRIKLEVSIGMDNLYPNRQNTGPINEIPGRVVYCQPDKDLAVIRVYVKENSLSALVLSDRQELKAGEPVLLFGYPDNSWSVAVGEMLESDRPTIHDDYNYYGAVKNAQVMGRHVEHLAPATQGFSGGPILDAKGAVVGITNSGSIATQSGPLATDAIGMSANELIAHLLDPLARNQMRQVCSQTLSSLVMVFTEVEGSGTGFIADKSGLIITNCHVVEDWHNVGVLLTVPIEANRLYPHQQTQGTDWHNVGVLLTVPIEANRLYPHQQTQGTVDVIMGRVVYCQPDKDLAVIRVYVKEDSLPALVLSDRRPLNAGEPVLVFGFPDLSLSVAVGELLGSDRSTMGGDMGSDFPMINANLLGRHVEHLAAATQGFSGGPILDGKGAVVGIHNAGSVFTGSGPLATDAIVVLQNAKEFEMKTMREKYSMAGKRSLGVKINKMTNTFWVMSSAINRPLNVSDVPLVASIPAIIAGNDWYEYIRHNNTTKSHTNSLADNIFKLLITTRIAHLLDPLATVQMRQVCNQSVSSVALIYTTHGKCGTGFVVDKSGLIITNSHVVQDWQYVNVKFTARVDVTQVIPINQRRWLDVIPGQVVYCQPDKDLAVIRVYAKEDSLPALVLSDRRELKAGEPVLVFGYPDLALSVAVGEMLGSDRLIWFNDMDYNTCCTGAYSMCRHVEHLAPATRGFSGSPILDGKGAVVGIHNSGSVCVRSGLLATDAIGMSANGLVVGNGWENEINGIAIKSLTQLEEVLQSLTTADQTLHLKIEREEEIKYIDVKPLPANYHNFAVI
ncbi:unnamed protein product [Medioppia subpectinata]|uniref:Serine protease n=1 Tax=Medioppia subpectinata TaxID=1979941 RepID=A0A7R9KU20_9ACAR|nr:unnamed protein product [Medioppia subpectinata]CAG2109836.1 unnamed protein product [Medioppia subpectinata]